MAFTISSLHSYWFTSDTPKFTQTNFFSFKTMFS